MTLKQIELLREIVRQSMNISAAALALGTSQPGVSRQIQDLERELGTPLLVRKRNRIVALTEAGRMVLTAAERLLGEVENIRLIGAEVRHTGGRLVVATTHLHARYTLLGPFQRLRTMHAEVELLLLQSVADDIDKLVAAGDADIGVGTGENGDIAAPSPRIARLAGEVLRRSAIIPIGHPLARRSRLSLEELGSYPLVGYGACSPTGLHIGRAFAALGITPNYIVRASDFGRHQGVCRSGHWRGDRADCMHHAIQAAESGRGGRHRPAARGADGHYHAAGYVSPPACGRFCPHDRTVLDALGHPAGPGRRRVAIRVCSFVMEPSDIGL